MYILSRECAHARMRAVLLSCTYIESSYTYIG